MKSEKRIQFFITDDCIQVYLEGQSYQVRKVSEKKYTLVYDLLTTFEDWGDEDKVDSLINELVEVLDKKKKILKFVDSAGVSIIIENGLIRYKGHIIKSVLTSRIEAIVDQEGSPQAIINFIENLLQNPSTVSVNELYLFLEYNSIPITDDGCFLAYKKVRNNWKDIHSATILNTIGSTITMDRGEVDPDRERTCSFGYHVCAYDYLSQFSSYNNNTDRVLCVKVNPKNVVAVPSDYNNAKMRVCEYTVLEEIENWGGRKLKDNYVSSDEDLYEDWDDYSDTEEYEEEYEEEAVVNEYGLLPNEGNRYLENFTVYDKVNWKHANNKYEGFIIDTIRSGLNILLEIDNLDNYFLKTFKYDKSNISRSRDRVKSYDRYLIACTVKNGKDLDIPILMAPATSRFEYKISS